MWQHRKRIPNGKKAAGSNGRGKGCQLKKINIICKQFVPITRYSSDFPFRLARSSEVLLDESQRRRASERGKKSHNNRNINRGQMYFPAFGCSPRCRKIATFRANVATGCEPVCVRGYGSQSSSNVVMVTLKIWWVFHFFSWHSILGVVICILLGRPRLPRHPWFDSIKDTLCQGACNSIERVRQGR